MLVDSNQFIGSKNEKPVIFKSNDVERFRITPSGDLGIGTSTPEAKLDVNGDVILRGSVAMYNIPQGTILNDYHVLHLDANGELKSVQLSEMLGGVFNEKPCNQGYTINPYWVSQPNKLYVHCPDVLVGINTSDPRVNLDVDGTTYTGSMAVGSDPVQLSNDLVKFRLKGYNASSNESIFEIQNNSGDIFTLSNQGDLNLNGQIVINSTSAKILTIHNGVHKVLQLEQDGMLRLREAKVDAQVWSDYVFDEDYELKALDSVELYIQQNHHLPDVPSEEEVLEEGINLAEMNKILLQKIEELTLYMIEQEKRIKELEQNR